MNYCHFIGIDVSKKTLDFSLVSEGKVLLHLKVENNKEGIKSFFKKIRKDFRINYQESIFCLEPNGIYNNILINELIGIKANIWVESALQIKQSQGMVRGKNDKIDSCRIALYAYRHQEKFIAWNPPRETISKIKLLLVLRSRIVEAIKQLATPVGVDAEIFFSKSDLKLSRNSCESSIKAMKNDVRLIEKQIKELISQDENLKKLFKIVMSIEGIGLIIASTIIVATNEFKNFENAKKFSCYSGVVPFEHSSGSSIRGRTKVSHLANKNVKKMLHLAAITCIRKDGEFKEYYDRKVSEGKHKMSVINAIRNKIVLRIFACVRDNRIFEKKHQIIFA